MVTAVDMCGGAALSYFVQTSSIIKLQADWNINHCCRCGLVAQLSSIRCQTLQLWSALTSARRAVGVLMTMKTQSASVLWSLSECLVVLEQAVNLPIMLQCLVSKHGHD